MTRSSLSAPLARCLFVSSTSRLVTTAVFILLASQACSAAYYGKLIGKLSELHHGVSGEVYAVDGRTLYIKDFTYDGEAPAAYFYAGSSKNPNGNGFQVRDERGTTDLLRKYRKKSITLTLPEGKTFNNIKWFSVWCDEFAVNFGDVRIPRGFDYPRPQKLAALAGVHGVSSEPIVVVDAQTLLIPGFSYDGEAPDAKFWVGSGNYPTPQGERVPDENGRTEPLRHYERKTIVLTLPGDLTVHQLGHFGVWCEAFTVDFGHVLIPAKLNVPPSLKMLGVSPQNLREGQGQASVGLGGLTLPSSNNRAGLLDGILSASGGQFHAKNSGAPGGSTPGTTSLFAGSQRYERPTTYRPALFRRRSDDRVQIVKSLEYRVPKSVKLEDAAASTLAFTSSTPQHQQSVKATTHGRPTTAFASSSSVRDEPNFETLPSGRDLNNDEHSTTRSYKTTDLDDKTLSSPATSGPRRIIYPGGSTTYHHVRDSIPRAETQQRQQQPQQQASYARLRSFQGDQRVDSYVRY